MKEMIHGLTLMKLNKIKTRKMPKMKKHNYSKREDINKTIDLNPVIISLL